MPRNEAPVKFEDPPVVEVAFSVQFVLGGFKTAHVGLFWQSARKEFPNIEDKPPIPAVVESFSGLESTQVELLKLPPLRRTWFVATDGGSLIQLQDDRFIYNWKRNGDQDRYPGYDVVGARFEQQFDRFLNFLKVETATEPTVQQCELAYINHIEFRDGLDHRAQNSLFVDHVREQSKDRFLPDPENFQWSTSYVLNHAPNTRLHVVARTAKRVSDQAPLVRLDMIARGLPEDTSAVGRKTWFDKSHELITRGFVDVTDSEVQKRQWRRVS